MLQQPQLGSLYMVTAGVSAWAGTTDSPIAAASTQPAFLKYVIRRSSCETGASTPCSTEALGAPGPDILGPGAFNVRQHVADFIIRQSYNFV